MGKLVAIETFERFQLLQNDNQIQDTSLIFILDTGQFYTHGILFNSVSYGAINNDTVTLNVGGTSKTLSLASHTHSNYYAKNADLDIDDYKIVSGSAPLLYYEDDVVKVGSTSTPTYLHGTLKALRGDNTYTILDTGNTSIENKTISGVSMSNVATFKYGNSNFQLDYVKRENTIIALDTLASYTNMGTTNENSKFYGFMTMYTDGRAIDPKFAQIRINIDDNILEFRSSSNRNWTGLLQGGAYKNITINGTTYSLVTKSNSLPTLYIPTSLGSGGQCLSVADDGGSLVWRTITIPEIVTNSKTQNGVVLKGQGNPNKVWMTDADGAPNWRDLNVNSILAAATTTALGGIKVQSINTNAVTPNTDAESSGRHYGVRIDTNELAYVNVPWQDTWIAWAGATTTADGISGYMPGATIADRLKYLRGDGTWQELNNYSLPTASSTTLGGVKTGATVTDISDLIAVHIKDDVIYYKDTTYTFYDLLFHDGTNVVDTYKPTTTPSKTLKAGSNVSISAALNIITIASTDTWNAMTGATSSANGTVGYINAIPPKDGYNTKFLRADGTWSVPAYPTKSSWNYNDMYVSSLTTSGNYLRWVKNGSNNDITIPYATSAGNADTVDNKHADDFAKRVVHSSMTTDIPTDLVDGIHIIHRPGIEYSTVLAMHDYSGAYFQIYHHPTDGYSETVSFRSNNTGGSWRTFIDSSNIGSQSVNYATSAGNSDTIDGYHEYSFAHRGTANNLLCAGNEFNFISAGFSGDVWFNYQDENRGSAANINSYYFGNGRSNWSPMLHAGGYITPTNSSAYALTTDGGAAHIGSMSVNYANSAGSSTTAAYFPTLYIGGDQPNPQTYFSSTIGCRVAMTRYADIGMGTAWHDTLWINGYSGGDVPYMCALHFKRNSEPRFAISSQVDYGTGYGTMYEVITKYNIGSQSVNYASSAGSASSCDYANYVYCSSHIGSWRLSSDWDGSYFWLTAAYSGSLPCAVSYASSAGSTSYASSAGYADSCGSFSGAWAIEGGNEVNLIPSSFGYDRLWFNYTAKGGSHVNLNSNYFGNAHTGTVNCYAASFGNSSDIRYKQIIEYLSPSLEQIAYAPIFKFMWTNKYDPELHAGSSAQYWLGVVRELVHYDDYIDQYFLNYGETALISAVTVAKETLNLKNIVLQLQSENEQLKSRISMLESTVRLLTES